MKFKLKKRYYFIVFFVITLFFIIKQIYIVTQNQKNDYFNNLENNSDITNSITNISKKLHGQKYGLTGGHWGELLAHTFYGYSLVNLSLQNYNNENFKSFSVSELEFVLNYINLDGKKAFIDKETDIPLGIIYNGHKNQVLVGLVLLGEEKYKKELFKNSDYIYGYLNKNLSKNSQTYKGWSWYVDNVNAIYSLYIVDLLREKDGLNKKYDLLIREWILYMKKNVGTNGMIYSEAETPNLNYNQARGSALTWLLTYFYEIDNELFKEQFELYNKYFYDKSLSMGFSNDIPKGQKQINTISAGPVIFGYSSSATVLSLAMYKISNSDKYFYDNLKAIDMLFMYNNGEYLFGKSVLIDSLSLWGKTKIAWGKF